MQLNMNLVRVSVGAFLAAGLLVAGLLNPSTAFADDGGTSQESSQSQAVGSQGNDATIGQLQGNGNINVSPAIAVFGDASTNNYQGNDNSADASVYQGNAAGQSQGASQEASSGSSHGKGGPGGDGSQEASQGQSVGSQSSEAAIEQSQGNGNINISPAIAVFGDASTHNAQGNNNSADASVYQDNATWQSQEVEQRSDSRSQRGKPKHRGGGSQSAEQGQAVGGQSNAAEIEQKQGSGNVNVSPAVSIGDPKDKHDSGGASTHNAQGNDNEASASVGQSNATHQWQGVTQLLALGR